MATYREIQGYGYTPKPCWIAHAKALCGLHPKMDPNRRDPNRRVYPCPPDKFGDIQAALTYFGMIRNP